MGLTLKKVVPVILLISILLPNLVFSQNQDCTITAPYSPDKIYAKRYPSNISQLHIPIATKEWSNLEGALVSDDEYLTIDLERYERSHILRFSNFGFNVPQLSTIDGLRISFEGRSIGLGEIHQIQVQFYQSGPIGENVASKPALLGTEWINDTLNFDRQWKYGHHFDTWDKEWNPSEVNDDAFGFVLQIENQTDEFVQALIDQVSISVYYTPPHNLCAHECVIFSTEPIDGVTNFDWDFPNNFEQIFSPVNQHILNLNVIDNIEGSYQVCVTPEGQDQCCMDFIVMDCSLGSISNLVWKDANNNGLQDNGEEGIPNVRVSLFNENGYFLESQLTDSNGNYLFENLFTGNYKIKTSEPTNDCEVLPSANIDENLDSDYNFAYGNMCSGYFYLAPGQHRDDIDFGWGLRMGSVSGYVFSDKEGDGLIEGDLGIEDITINLHSCDGSLISTITTNLDGYYSFQDIPPGQYYISTIENEDYVNSYSGDSDFMLNSNQTPCFNVIPNEAQTIELGLIPLGNIGDFVFYDENSNGLQDSGDWPISNIQLFLLDEADQQVATTQTDESGFYLFENIPSGNYYIVLNYPTNAYLPTAVSETDDSEIDSDGIDIGNMQASSSIINLIDGASILNIDFGFIKRTANIIGTYYRDAQGDGLLTGDQGIPNASVSLFNCNGSLIATRITDENGQFVFTGFVGDNYHLVFEPIGGMQSSTLGESQIDNIFSQGATSCFSIQDENQITVNGSAIPLSRVGDMVWNDENRNGIYDNDEAGIENVQLTLFNSNDEIVGTTFSNAEGRYMFENLFPDDCYIEVAPIEEFEITESNMGSDESFDSDAIMVNGLIMTESFSLNDGYENMDMDIGFRRRGGSISGTFWHDGNGDNIYGNESGIANRTIRLFSCEGSEISSTLTSLDGSFIFSPVMEGSYYLVVDSNDGAVFSTNGDSQITNQYAVGSTDCFTVINGDPHDLILGEIPTSNLGDYVWLDANKNGMQDLGEFGIPNVSLSLFNDSNELISVAETDSEGKYLFEDIQAGNYIIHVSIPFGHNLTDSNVGDFNLDSEGTVLGSIVESSMLALRNGDDQSDHDFGFYQNIGSLQGLVWRDSDGDGIRDNEVIMEGISVSLYTCDMVLLNNTLTDSNGHYSFDNLFNGQYFIVVNPINGFTIATIGESQVTNAFMIGSTACFELNGNSFDNINVGYIPLASIGDYIWFDQNRNGIQDATENGLEGVEIGLLDSNGALTTITQSDSQGFYQFEALLPNTYSLSVTLPGEGFINTISLAGDPELDSEGTMINNTLNSDPIIIFDGINQFDHDFGFMEIEEDPQLGDINGQFLRDRDGDGILNGEPGIEEVTIILKSCDGNQIATTSTDSNGNFEFLNITSGDYYLVFPNLEGFTNLDFGESQIDNLIEQGSTSCFTVLPDLGSSVLAGSIPLNSIGDFVWNDLNKNGVQDLNEVGVENITLSLISDGGFLLQEITSDSDGFYKFDDLMPGNYFIYLNQGEFILSPKQASPNQELDSDFDLVNGFTQTSLISLYDGVQISSIDCGIYEDSGGEGGTEENVVSGFVFEDINGNGFLDTQEIGTNDIRVSLVLATSGLVLDEMFTSNNIGADGFYEFSGFPNGEYILQFELATSSAAADIHQGTDPALDSDIMLINGSFETSILNFEDGTVTTGINAGFYYPVSIGDFVWFDFNSNGIQDIEEAGANDYIIRLFDVSGQQVMMTTTKTNVLTGQNGFYQFNNLKPGEYYIGINVDFGTMVTIAQAGDENLDSNVDHSNGPGTTSTLKMRSGEQISNIDIGLLSTPGSIGNLLWVDNNGNGIQDSNEPGLNDVNVTLYDEDMNLIRSTTTSDDADGEAGFYIFENVPVGKYYIVFDLPSSYLSTVAFRGGNTSEDSDITNNIVQGSSNIFSIGSGVYSDDIDCGVYKPASVGDYVWRDNDKDGTQEFGEFGVKDVDISIYRIGEGKIETTATNNDGMYRFQNLRPGEYYIVADRPDGFQFSKQNSGDDNTIDSDVDMTGTTQSFYIDQEDNIINYDIGLVPAQATIGGRTWDDENGNGLQDFNELSITDVKVDLLDENMNLLNTIRTNVQGRYAFSNLSNGIHFIRFESPEGYIFTIKDQSFNDNEDSDAADNGLTDNIQVSNSTNLLTVDAGFVFIGFSPNPAGHIELIGYHDQGVNHLSWIDDQFEDGLNYNILRSTDGINFNLIGQISFEELGFLQYSDDISQLTTSSFYYKVERQKDNIASISSNIWKDEKLNRFEIKTYPNPASDFVNVKFIHHIPGVVKLSIYDLFGNQITTKSFENVKAGNVQLIMPALELQSGNYFIRLETQLFQKSELISILK